MKTKEPSVSYSTYKENVLEKLTNNKNWDCGVWKKNGTCVPKKHIFPLKDQQNNSKNRAQAIKKYLGFDCKPYFPSGFRGLHQYAHHINSSQTLCVMFFSKLIRINPEDQNLNATDDLVRFMKKAFNITIHEGAKCYFEYKEVDIEKYTFNVLGKKEYEGTSFDFHIKDADVEVYFEIKFTEDGFKKENTTTDERHRCKANQYVGILPSYLKNKVNEDDFLRNYQIFRNIIRAEDENKYVIFITDGNNPHTNKDITNFFNSFGKYIESSHIQFKTWQELINIYPYYLPQFVAF